MIISQPVSNYILKSILTTQGDMLIQGAAAAERLAIGTSNLVLTSNGAGANQSWQDPHKVMTTQGDILKRGASAGERLAIGLPYKILQVNAGGTEPIWEYNKYLYDEEGAQIFMIKFFDIGDWDMDTDASKIVAHGLSVGSIVVVMTFIRDDADSLRYPIDYDSGSGANGSVRISAGNVLLTRLASGIFDHVDYNATSYNRGWIAIMHV